MQSTWTLDTRTHLLQSRAQANQHQALLYAIFPHEGAIGVPHQVEIGEPFAADRGLRVSS